MVLICHWRLLVKSMFGVSCGLKLVWRMQKSIIGWQDRRFWRGFEWAIWRRGQGRCHSHGWTIKRQWVRRSLLLNRRLAWSTYCLALQVTYQARCCDYIQRPTSHNRPTGGARHHSTAATICSSLKILSSLHSANVSINSSLSNSATRLSSTLTPSTKCFLLPIILKFAEFYRYSKNIRKNI